MRILNASGSSYPRLGTLPACASYDQENWFRVPTSYDGKEVTIWHVPEADCVWYAYFVPYLLEQHEDLIARVQQSMRCAVEVIGETMMAIRYVWRPSGSGRGAAARSLPVSIPVSRWPNGIWKASNVCSIRLTAPTGRC